MTTRVLVPLVVPALVLASSAWAAEGHRCLIEPDRVAEVGSQVIGVVDSLHVERGDPVRSGQLLARLRADVEHASVTVAQARARADADLKAAQANFEFQNQKFVRAEELVQKNFISQQALEQVRAERKVAEQRLVQAREQQEVAQRELDLARAQLRMRAIRAPFDGIVAERYVTVGERIEDRPMFRLARIDPLRIEVVVPAALFGSVEKGMLARITPDLPKAESLDAKVMLVDRLVDPASNTFRVRAELANPGGVVPSGLRCRAAFHAAAEAAATRRSSAIAPPPPGAGAVQIDLKIDSELTGAKGRKPGARNQ